MRPCSRCCENYATDSLAPARKGEVPSRASDNRSVGLGAFQDASPHRCKVTLLEQTVRGERHEPLREPSGTVEDTGTFQNDRVRRGQIGESRRVASCHAR